MLIRSLRLGLISFKNFLRPWKLQLVWLKWINLYLRRYENTLMLLRISISKSFAFSHRRSTTNYRDMARLINYSCTFSWRNTWKAFANFCHELWLAQKRIVDLLWTINNLSKWGCGLSSYIRRKAFRNRSQIWIMAQILNWTE